MPLSQNQLTLSSSALMQLEAYTDSDKFLWAAELRHLASHKFLKISWWPLFKLQQRWFTHSPFMSSCKKMPEFGKLWNTIQKGAFAYNHLFLDLSPFRRHSTDLADITTLALFFGDEFIDGLAETAGKDVICELMENDPKKLYLHKKIKENKVNLQYCFNLNELLPPEVLHSVNTKYKISYKKFHETLQHFLKLMNEYLRKLPFEKAEKAADKIADACNTCFKSFLHDVHSCPVQNNLPAVADVLHFHELKTAYMQEKLLELRCILAGKEQAMFSIQTPGWLDIMRVIQIYDDIQDMIIDDGLQDNLVLSVAYHYFPHEWKWFNHNKNLLVKQQEKYLLLSFYMPCSLQYCMQLAGDKIKTMNWEQQKIMHYLLMKNKYVLYKKENNFAKDDFLFQFYLQTKSKMPHLSLQAIKSFAIDVCIHLGNSRRNLLRRVNFSTAYQLRYNLFTLSSETKANIFDKITAK